MTASAFCLSEMPMHFLLHVSSIDTQLSYVHLSIVYIVRADWSFNFFAIYLHFEYLLKNGCLQVQLWHLSRRYLKLTSHVTGLHCSFRNVWLGKKRKKTPKVPYSASEDWSPGFGRTCPSYSRAEQRRRWITPETGASVHVRRHLIILLHTEYCGISGGSLIGPTR